MEGEGNEIAFENRIYDPRIAKWLSLDPLQNKYPGESHYAFVSNNPILYADKDGRDKIVTMTIIGKDGTVTQIQKTDHTYFNYGTDHREGGIGLYYWKTNVYQNIIIDLQNNTANATITEDDNHQYITGYEYSKASDWVNGVVNFFSSQTGDNSDKTQYGWRIYGKGHDMEWQKGLPTIAPGSDESIDLKQLLEIAEGMREKIELSDLAEKFGSKKVAGLIEKIEKAADGAEKVASWVEENKRRKEQKANALNSKNNNKGPELTFKCPDCGQKTKMDSANIDKNYGAGAYRRLKAQQELNKRMPKEKSK